MGTRRAVVLAVAFACGLAVLAGCSSSSTKAGSSSTTVAPTATTSGTANSSDGPKVGSCLEPITGPVAEGFQLPAIVPCADPHGGEIVADFKIPLGPTAPYPGSNTQLSSASDTVKQCTGDSTHLGAFGAFVGDDALAVPSSLSASTGVTQAWRVSGLQPALFIPGTAAWARGERWLACAAVLSNSQDVPSTYTGSAKGVRSTPGGLPTQFSWCKEEPDASKPNNFQTVSCAKDHNYEQIVSFAAGTASATFPGEAALDQDGTQLCAPLLSTATGGKTDHLAATLGISWTFPQQGDWANGARIVRCFVTTRTGDSTGSVDSH